MAKKKKRKKARRPYTPLTQHQKKGSVLHSPYNKMPFEMYDWAKDILPECLWIAALIEHFGKKEAYKFYYKFMDVIDEFWPDGNFVAMGLLTDFGVIPDTARKQLWSHHEELLVECFHKPFARVLTFYPKNPAAWLVRKDLVDRGGHVDPDVELERLRQLVANLYPRQGELATLVTALALGRLLPSCKFNAPKLDGLIKLLEKYPIDCTESEKQKVESFARSLVCGTYMQKKRYAAREWPKYFWRHNFDLTVCKPVNLAVEGYKSLGAEAAHRLQEILQRNANRVRCYLESLRVQAKYDLYSPERGEILLGLFARLTRFYILMTEVPNLWAKDIAGILLRCLTDTAITFVYLVKCGKDEEFVQFKKYGEGQEKLLLLHLQDSYPSEKSLEGRDVESIGKELGWLTPELMDIELGHWNKKDTRKLAQAAGMEKYYRLVYTPTSSDLHGSWMSLKHSNLCHCSEPLHRFHRLPTYLEPPLFLETIVAAQGLFEECLQTGMEKLDYPPLDDPLEPTLPE
ncbi:hypothetical protein KA005_17845 [bacterium]|nr:hypothetical protein [bacterium]